MNLKDYKGPANSHEIFQYLVGEQIVGVLQESGEHTNTYFVLGSGEAFVLCSTGAYWKAPAEGRDSWRAVVTKCKEEIARYEREIRRLGAIEAFVAPSSPDADGSHKGEV